MNSEQSTEERLWEYIDGTSPASEIAVIEKYLKDDAEWKHIYMELLNIQQLLQSSEPEQPSLRFTKSVMEKISANYIIPASKKYIDKKIIWAIGAFLITLITGFVIFGFTQVDWNITSKSNFPVDFSKSVSSFFDKTYIYIFLMINVVLGIMLFDRFLAGKNVLRHVG